MLITVGLIADIACLRKRQFRGQSDDRVARAVGAGLATQGRYREGGVIRLKKDGTINEWEI